MVTTNSRTLVLLALLAAMTTLVSQNGRASPLMVDPVAVQMLKNMTSYTANLEGFSVTTQVTLEQQLDSGQRVDSDISSRVTIRRPNKIRADRLGEQVSQSFYYDGDTLTIFNLGEEVYASQAAPGTINELLDFARESLGIFIPVSDLVYTNAFDLLMVNVTSAVVVGTAWIDEVNCMHLAFSRPDVDFQVWIAEGELPLPCKYVVTDTSTPEMVSTVTVMRDWALNQPTPDSVFSFVAPAGAMPVDFVPVNSDPQL